MDIKEIEMRVEALKATAVSGGAESTSGLMIIINETPVAKETYRIAILLEKSVVMEMCCL